MRAFDVHVHPSTRGLDHHACGYFKRNLAEIPQTAGRLRRVVCQERCASPLIGWHPSTVNEGARNSNEHVLDLVDNFPRHFPGILAALDTNAADLTAVARYAEELVKNAKVKGFKFHPPDQGFYPNDKRFYDIWEIIQASGKPALFHVGFTVLGANTDGGSGIALDYGRPIYLDTLARDFPKMKIIAAHPGWPWEQELIGVVTHKKNLFVDTSGYLAEQLPEFISKSHRRPAAGQSALRHRFSLRRFGKGVGEFRQNEFQADGEGQTAVRQRPAAIQSLARGQRRYRAGWTQSMKRLLLLVIINFQLSIIHSFAAQSAANAKLRVGYPSPSAAFYPLFATKEAGLLEKYGFDSEMVYVQGVKLVQVHVSGQLDISTVSSVVYLQASVGGADLIQVASSIDNQIMKLMVHQSIAKPQDLKGKTLAVTGFGSLTDLLVRPALKNWGLEPQKDVKLVQIGRMPDIATAIAQKTVDGGMLSFPTSLHAEKFNLKTLIDFAESGFESPATTVVVSRRYANANRDTVLRFLKAYIEGTKRLLTDRELGIRALRRYGGVSDRDMLATTHDLFTSRYIKKIPKINPKGVENSLSMIAENNPKARGRKAEEFMDPSFMDELEATGFIKSVWP